MEVISVMIPHDSVFGKRVRTYWEIAAKAAPLAAWAALLAAWAAPLAAWAAQAALAAIPGSWICMPYGCYLAVRNLAPLGVPFFSEVLFR